VFFLGYDSFIIATFTGLIVAALALRRRSDHHKRLMLLATLKHAAAGNRATAPGICMGCAVRHRSGPSRILAREFRAMAGDRHALGCLTLRRTQMIGWILQLPRW